MKPTSRLLQHSIRVTLFTRSKCSLCEIAKTVVKSTSQSKTFDYREIDIMSDGQESWKQYEFDTPVVHVQRVFHTYSKPDIATEARKLMHRFNQYDLETLIEEAEGPG